MFAKEILDKSNIKSMDDFFSNLCAVAEILKEDVRRVLASEGKIFKNFNEKFSLSLSHTLDTIQKQDLKGVKRFLQSSTISQATAWLLQRLVANIKNQADPKYKTLYSPAFEISFPKEYYYRTADYREEIEKEILLEELHKMPKHELINALKKIWEEAKYTEGFDAKDIKELCEKYDINIYDVIPEKEFQAPNIVKKTDPKTGREYLYFSDLLD